MAKTKAKPPSPSRSRLVAAVPAKKSAKVGYAVGDKVSHKLFGIGKVLSQRGDILSIQFDKRVIKEIVADFVRPA